MSIAGKQSQTCGVTPGRSVVTTPVTGEDGDKRASKVSKLREMFQTGSVCPVEDWEENNEDLTQEQLRLLRTCPGSPPLLALRERSSASPPNAAVPKSNASNGRVPPARPPKPKDLWLKSGLTPRHVLPSVKSRISPRLWKTFTVFESGGATRAIPTSVPTKADAVAVCKAETDFSKVPTVSAAPTTQLPAVCSVTQPLDAAPHPAFEVDTVKKTADVSSQPLEHDSSTDFSAVADDDLQHAEPIAVATPDEDEDEESVENEMQRLGLTTVPQLEPPPGLKIVAVDSLGVHILEDGNFFYASPSVFAQAESPQASTPNPLNMSQADHSQADAGASGTALPLSTSDAVDESSAKRVRFSDGPILVFSTHSTIEYDRKNDEIDPIASSAAYELEKRLETMELFELDLKKVGQGLGLNIVGVGLDLDGGENLGIFIKTVVPGGAADLSQKVKPNDQIVEVDGINLVGVSYEFAARTLRNTGDTVHFILGRATDPANFWMLTEPDKNNDETTDSPNRSCN